MPVLSRQQIQFEGQIFMQVLSCNAKGTFTIKLPDRVAEMLGKDEVAAASKDDCLRMWGDALKQYRESKTFNRKIILYHVETKAHIYRDGKCIHATSDVTFASGIAISIVADVFDEVKIDYSTGKSRYEYKKQESSLPHSIRSDNHRDLVNSGHGEKQLNQIEWSLAREQFFGKLAIAMESIVLELTKLNQAEDLGKLIDNHSFKLLK